MTIKQLFREEFKEFKRQQKELSKTDSQTLNIKNFDDLICYALESFFNSQTEYYDYCTSSK